MMPMLKAAHAACKTVQNSVDELKGHLDPMKKADTGMKAEKPPGNPGTTPAFGPQIYKYCRYGLRQGIRYRSDKTDGYSTSRKRE